MRYGNAGLSCLKRRTPGDMRHGDNISLPDSVIETSKPVKLKDFAEHYRIMSADSDFRFSEEYEELKHVGREKPCGAADLPCNRPKNRFTNILPYDHSRVKLQPCDDDEGSDYINANFVPGFNSPREFIVTQGPLHSTRDDFWRMCWETNSRAIVMLTVRFIYYDKVLSYHSNMWHSRGSTYFGRKRPVMIITFWTYVILYYKNNFSDVSRKDAKSVTTIGLTKHNQSTTEIFRYFYWCFFNEFKHIEKTFNLLIIWIVKYATVSKIVCQLIRYFCKWKRN